MRLNIPKMLFFVTLIVAAALGLRLWITIGINPERFYPGVYVYGVSLGGYSYEDGIAELNRQIDKRLNTRYTLYYGDFRCEFIPAETIGASVEFQEAVDRAWNFGHTGSVFDRASQIRQIAANPVSMPSALNYSEESLNAFVEAVAQSVEREPVDAVVLLDIDAPRLISDAVEGLSLDRYALRDLLLSLTVDGGAGEYALPVDVISPAVDTAKAEGGLTRVVEHHTTTSTSSATRTSNIRLALSNFNAFAVAPGESVSFNAVVGSRTERRGYKIAPVYSGTTVTTGVGGGVCQASSTLYGALLKAGIQIDERTHHKMTVGYTEASLDAAVSEDASQDLKFTNNTDHTLYIYTSVDSQYATVTIYTTRPEYRIDLQVEIVQADIWDDNIRYLKDTTGEYVYYTDDAPVLQSEGKTGLKSRCVRIFYDWDTGAEIKREVISDDYYYPRPATYWVGAHERTAAPTATPGNSL